LAHGSKGALDGSDLVAIVVRSGAPRAIVEHRDAARW